MNESRKTRIPSQRWRRYFIGLIVFWTILVGGSLYWNIQGEKLDALYFAKAEARGVYNKDLVYRRWAASHGGVYVPMTEDTPPNPYLSHIKERDIVTPSGKKLTLMNPAYMTRQVIERGIEQYGLRGHITSLNPIRPENAPDNCEITALEHLNNGIKEVTSVEDIEGKKHLFLMRPMITEKSCLKCHAHQGYKEGDVRGGISVSVPMDPYIETSARHILVLGLGHGILWLIGLCGIILSTRLILRRVRERELVYNSLKLSESSLSQAQQIAQLGNWDLDLKTNELKWSDEVFQIFEISPEEFGGTYETFLDNIHPEDREMTDRTYKESLKNKTPYSMVHRLLLNDGKVKYVNELCETYYNEEGKPIRSFGTVQDITNRVLTEEALRESEGNFKDVIEHSNDAIYVLYGNKFDIVNRRFLDMIQCSHEEINNPDFTFWQLIAPESRTLIEERQKMRTEGIKPDSRYEFSVLNKEEKRIDVEASVNEIAYKDGKAVLGILRDITERNEAGELLKRNTAIVEAINNVFRETLVCETEEEVAYTCINMAEKLTGSEYGLIGVINEAGRFDTLSYGDLGWAICKIAESEAIALSKDMEIGGIWGQALLKGESQIVNDLTDHPESIGTPEGHPKINQFLGVPLKHSGEIIGMIGLANKQGGYQDADQEAIESLSIALVEALKRKRAELALRESEERYRALFEGSPEGILITDNNSGRFVYVNSALCKMFDYSEDELKEMSRKDLHPDESLQHVISEFEAQARGDKSLVADTPCLRKDGSVIYADISSTGLFINERKSTVSFYTDITEEKLLEEKFQQAQKMEGIGQLAGGIAHDFNNLLTVIIGYSEIALITLDEKDELYKNLDEILKAGHSAADLTQQLLAFSRKQTLEPKVIRLDDIVTNIEKMLQRIIGEDIDLETDSEEQLWNVKADPGQMQQIIVNLAANARDAMPEGGKLYIETHNVYLDEEYARLHPDVTPGPHVMLALSDNGCGMSDEVMEKVFEPFFTTKTEGRGTGLGLATVYGIVKQSGGNIWIYSELDEGTTFKIYLPMSEEKVDELVPDVGGKKLPIGTETILLVEDEKGVRELAFDVLKQQGYRITTAKDGEEGLTLFKKLKKPVDLIVSDIIMPNMGGVEFINKVQEKQPDIKVLYMSGYTSNGIVHSGVLQPGKPYLQKPFRIIDLIRKVRVVLDS